MPKVSVIMPSLNVAKYIRECMKSVLGQTLRDIEVIAVDAGSEDGTLEILREYETQDCRVRVILSEKRSYGYQMNLGMGSASGEYIFFVETDDILLSHTLEDLVFYLDAYDVDYVKGYSYAFIDLPNGSRYTTAIDKTPRANGRKEYFFAPNQMPWLLMSEYHFWVGLYRKSFLQGVRFNETPGAAFQDIGFIIQIILKSYKALYVEKPVYYYREGNSGSSVYNHNGFRYLVDEYSWNEQFLQGKEDIWRKFFYSRMFAQCLARFHYMALSGNYWMDARPIIECLQEKLRLAKDRGDVGFGTLTKLECALFQLFMLSEKDVYDYFSKDCQLKIAKVKELLSHLPNRPILIWGCGNYGKYIHAILSICGVSQVEAFVDSNVSLQGQVIQGIRVIAPCEAVAISPYPFFLIASKRHADDIRYTLLAANVPEKNIYYQDMEIDDMILPAIRFRLECENNN